MSQARRFTSPQGYTVLVAPGFTMTPEEPCCDQAWPDEAPDSFMRIERIDAGVPVERLREDAELALSAVGPAMPAREPLASAAHELELQLLAEAGRTRLLMSVLRVDGVRYRITRHLRGDSGTVEAAMQAMLDSLENTQ